MEGIIPPRKTIISSGCILWLNNWLYNSNYNAMDGKMRFGNKKTGCDSWKELSHLEKILFFQGFHSGLLLSLFFLILLWIMRNC
jgi:hypothetical protein